MPPLDRRILVTGTFPIEQPQHGGQKRTRAIVDAYRRRFAHVEHVAVFEPRHYGSAASPNDIPLPSRLADGVPHHPVVGDLIAGHAIAEDPEVRARFTALLRSFRPDIIHVECPFPWLGLGPLLADEGLAPRVVFGSENIEAPLREQVMRAFGVDERIIEEAVGEIDRLERALSGDCDLLAACTPSDLKAHRAMGATRTVLAPNGMSPLRPDPAERAHWRERFRAAGVERIALFVGSGHMPNQVGFDEVVGRGLGFLRRHERLVLAGSIGDAVVGRLGPADDSIEAATFPLRAENAGRLPEPRLQGLIAEADVLLLPITAGGGSNLKTAEAILADTRVVATTTALRGFEWFADFPNVWVADTRDDFHRAIREAFASPLRPRSPEQAALAETVTWEHCLAPLVEAVAQL